jgi:hypothetical protein
MPEERREENNAERREQGRAPLGDYLVSRNKMMSALRVPRIT